MPTDHHELASALTALYETMDKLALLSEDEIELPRSIYYPPYPENIFNAENALKAGFSQEAVDAMQQIPYLKHYGDEILPSTCCVCMVSDNPSVEFYSEQRDMVPNTDEPEENHMPPSALRLTGIRVSAAEYIYDAATKLVHPWEPWGDISPDDYRGTAPVSPWDAFGPIISSLQRLELVGDGGDMMNRLGPEWYHDYPISEDTPQTTRDQVRALNEMDNNVRKLRDMYLECGWDVNARSSVQPTFRRNDFIAQREAFQRGRPDGET